MKRIIIITSIISTLFGCGQSDKNVKLDKIIFHTSMCFGTCPTYHLQVDNNREVKLYAEQVYKNGSYETDTTKTGYFVGIVADTTFRKLTNELGVRGFPTIFFTDTTEKKEIVYSSNPYSTFENALVKLYPNASKKNYDKTWSTVFSKYHSLTAKEFSELTEIPRNESEKYLDNLTAKGHLEKLTTKNGAIWTLKNTSR